MSDPLGLLNTSSAASSDPLGLLTAPRPIPELRAGNYETEGGLWDRLFTGGPAAENAKAQNTMAISAQYGLPPSIVNDHYDEITKQQGFADQPTFRELIEKPITGGVVAGLLSHPLATAVGIVSFGALSEAENFIASKVASKPYQFGAGRGLADMLPEDTEQGFKDLVWTADMAWKALASGGLIKASKPAAENFAARYMRDTIEKYNLPRTVFFSPEKIREFHGMGREDVITPDEAAILKDIGLTRDQYVSALQNGIDIEIPAEKIINVVDKPWWAAMKQFFKASPYDTTVVSRGKGEAKAPIAGLLEEPAVGTAPKQPVPVTEQALPEVGAVTENAIIPPETTPKVVGGEEPWAIEFAKEAKKHKTVDEFIDTVRGNASQYRAYTPNLRKHGTTIESERMDRIGVSPDQDVTIYRGINKNGIKNATINDGDYVVTDYESAKSYGGENVISRQVKAKDLIVEFPDEFDKNNPFQIGAEFVYSDSKNLLVKHTDAELADIWNKAHVLPNPSRPPKTEKITPVPAQAMEIKGVVYRTAVPKDRLSADPDWQAGKKEGDHEAAARFADNNWDEGKTEKVLSLVDNPSDVVFISQPSTSGKNVIPLALAEKLAKDTGGEAINGRELFDVLHGQESKTIGPPERMFYERIYEPVSIEEIVGKIGNREVIVVDDIYTTGSSALALINSLREAGVNVKGHAGYFGDARLAAKETDIARLQAAFDAAGMKISAADLAGVLTRNEIGRMVQNINKTRTQDGRDQLAERIRGILDRKAIRASEYAALSSIPGGRAGGGAAGNEPSGQGIPSEPGLQNEEITSTEDINALFDAASRTDAAVGIPATEGYDKIRAQAARIAFENVTKKLDLQKRRQERDLKRQGMETARQEPAFQAMEEAIKAGGLDKGVLEKLYHKATVAELAAKRIGLVREGGTLGLDDLAARTGFESDDALMTAMLDWAGLQEAGKKAADAFEAQYSELMTDAEMEDFHLQLLEEEAKILRKMIKETGKPSAPGIKKVIREQTGQIRVEELTVSTYEALTAGMKKAEQASRKAFREGKLDGALAEKERQIEMSKSRKEKLKAKEEAKAIHDGIIKLTKDKSIPEEYQERITDLLEGFDLLPRSKKTAARVESAREFLERQKQSGEDVTIPESMLNRIERYGKTHWRELTLDQLREIYDQAQMYAHIGKLKNKLIAAGKKRDFEKTVAAIVTEVGKNWGVKAITPEELESMFLEPTFGEKLGDFKQSYLGSLTKVETYLRRLDGFKDMGTAWENVYLPVKQASDVEYRNLADITNELKDLFGPMRKTLTKEKFKIPGVNQFLTRETVIMTALNSGNEGNLAALRENNIYGWDSGQIAKILANVTPEEWLLVRGIWDLFEKQYPGLAEVYKNLSGTTLKKIEGDYFPLVFDRKLSWIADRNATEKELRDFFQSIYTLPSVRTGSTIERTGGKLPPKLKFTVIFEKLAEINHYITHAEAIRDVQKIVGDPRVRAAIEGAPSGIGGPEAYKEIMSWLQDNARQQIDPLSAVESAIKTARINTTTVAMGWKFSTAASQFLGLGNTIYKIGPTETAKALIEFYTDREALVEKIKGMSAEVAGRAKSFDRELRDAYNRIGLEHFRGSSVLKDSFFSIISLMDMAVAYPTWLGAKNKGMKELGGDEAKAGEYADMILRTSQGAGLVKDLAGIQRGSELKKIVSMFYTFFSAYHQMMADAWLKFKFDKSGHNFVDLMRAWWWLTIMPAAVWYMIRERDIPSPGTLLKEVLQQRLTAYPVVRDITSVALTGYSYSLSPVAKAGETTARALKEGAKIITPGEEVEFDKLFKAGFESAGYFTGLPTAQAIITMQGFIDLKNGETSDLTRLMFRAPREDNE